MASAAIAAPSDERSFSLMFATLARIFWSPRGETGAQREVLVAGIGRMQRDTGQIQPLGGEAAGKGHRVNAERVRTIRDQALFQGGDSVADDRHTAVHQRAHRGRIRSAGRSRPLARHLQEFPTGPFDPFPERAVRGVGDAVAASHQLLHERHSRIDLPVRGNAHESEVHLPHPCFPDRPGPARTARARWRRAGTLRRRPRRSPPRRESRCQARSRRPGASRSASGPARSSAGSAGAAARSGCVRRPSRR